MIASLRPGVTLPQASGPVIETERLRLRQWQGNDMAPYTAMLSDPGTARFITVDGKPVTDEITGWRHTVVMAGHWVLHGAGMFVVEEKSSGNLPDGSGRGSRRAGPALKSVGVSQKNFAAKATQRKPRERRSTGRLPRSLSTALSIVLTARISRPKAWRVSSAPGRMVRSNYSVMPLTSG